MRYSYRSVRGSLDAQVNRSRRCHAASKLERRLSPLVPAEIAVIAAQGGRDLMHSGILPPRTLLFGRLANCDDCCPQVFFELLWTGTIFTAAQGPAFDCVGLLARPLVRCQIGQIFLRARRVTPKCDCGCHDYSRALAHAPSFGSWRPRAGHVAYASSQRRRRRYTIVAMKLRGRKRGSSGMSLLCAPGTTMPRPRISPR